MLASNSADGRNSIILLICQLGREHRRGARGAVLAPRAPRAALNIASVHRGVSCRARQRSGTIFSRPEDESSTGTCWHILPPRAAAVAWWPALEDAIANHQRLNRLLRSTIVDACSAWPAWSCCWRPPRRSSALPGSFTGLLVQPRKDLKDHCVGSSLAAEFSASRIPRGADCKTSRMSPRT